MIRYLASTACGPVKRKLKESFSEYGIPGSLTTDNGPPFQSEEFRAFCKELGIKHRLITPYWPRANGMVESFMKRLGRVLKTASIDGVDWKKRAIQFLRNYNSTPHTSTGVAPCELFFRNSKTTKLPSARKFERSKMDNFAIFKDKVSKKSMKKYADVNLKTKAVRLQVGDQVMVKQKILNKTMSPWGTDLFTVIKISNNMVTAKLKDRSITRNVSFFKKWVGDRIEDSDQVIVNTTQSNSVIYYPIYTAPVESETDTEQEGEEEADDDMVEEVLNDILGATEDIMEESSEMDILNALIRVEISEQGEVTDHSVTLVQDSQQEDSGQSNYNLRPRKQTNYNEKCLSEKAKSSKD